jgi:hypothetical protein
MVRAHRSGTVGEPAFTSVFPELCKPSFCQRRAPRCRLQIAMAQVVRQRSSVVAITSKLVSAGMAKHVVMNCKGKFFRTVAATLFARCLLVVRSSRALLCD